MGKPHSLFVDSNRVFIHYLKDKKGSNKMEYRYTLFHFIAAHDDGIALAH